MRLPSTPGVNHFSCCAYIPSTNNDIIAAGTFDKKVWLCNTATGTKELFWDSEFEWPLVDIESSRNGEFLLASSRGACKLWNTYNHEDVRFFQDKSYAEFSKTAPQDQVVATWHNTATVYSMETRKSIYTINPHLSNDYEIKRATFNYDDQLILIDGAIFDVRSGRQIHLLDKLNASQSGVFHPNGLEIIANGEIWDLRTFHLRRMVNYMDCQHILFNESATIMFTFDLPTEHDRENAQVTTFDARTYDRLACISKDSDTTVLYLSLNPNEAEVAVAQEEGERGGVVRIFQIGAEADEEDPYQDVEMSEEDQEPEEDYEDDESVESHSSENEPEYDEEMEMEEYPGCVIN